MVEVLACPPAGYSLLPGLQYIRGRGAHRNDPPCTSSNPWGPPALPLWQDRTGILHDCQLTAIPTPPSPPTTSPPQWPTLWLRGAMCVAGSKPGWRAPSAKFIRWCNGTLLKQLHGSGGAKAFQSKTVSTSIFCAGRHHIVVQAQPDFLVHFCDEDVLKYWDEKWLHFIGGLEVAQGPTRILSYIQLVPNLIPQ